MINSAKLILFTIVFSAIFICPTSAQISISEVKINNFGQLEKVYLQLDNTLICIDAFGNLLEFDWLYDEPEQFTYHYDNTQDIGFYNDLEVEYEDGIPIRIGNSELVYHAFYPHKILSIGRSVFEYEYKPETGGQLVRIEKVNFFKRLPNDSRLESIGDLEIEYDPFEKWISNITGEISANYDTQLTIHRIFITPDPSEN